MDFEIDIAFIWNLKTFFRLLALLMKNQQARFASTLFFKNAKDFVPMDLDLLRARQPDFQHKKKNKNVIQRLLFSLILFWTCI